MSTITAIRPAAALPGEVPASHHGRGAAAKAGIADIHDQTRNPPATASETANPVPAPAQGKRVAVALQSDHSLNEVSRARLLAAQRAYVAAARAAGYNPLITGIP